ncbi:MAG: hypothetical protein OHK0015_11830 [Chloroflexi bacterium OHK40]
MVRKRVLLLGNYPPPFGGVPTHIQYLADHLSARAWDVHVVSYVGRRAGLEEGHNYPVYRLLRRSRWAQLLRPSCKDLPHLWAHRRAAVGTLRLLLSWIGTMHFVRQLVRRQGIHLVSAYHLLGAGVVGSWLHREFGTGLITTIFGEIYNEPALHRRRLHDVSQVVEHSARLLSCSHHCAASFRLLGLSPYVETVHYGVDITRFRPGCGGDALRRGLGIMPSVPVAIYVARMVREMGLGVLMEAIPEVLLRRPEVVFLVVGRRGELTPAAQALATRYPGQVIVAPDVPFAQLPAYYDASSFGVAPSINDRACLGLAIAEAMATARPVIGAGVGGTAEVIADGETGILVPPEDPSSLVRAILELVDDQERCRHMGQASRERAITLFDKEVTNQRMERIFEEVLA